MRPLSNGLDRQFGFGRSGHAQDGGVTDVGDRQIQQHSDVAVIQPIEHVATRAATGNDPVCSHQAKRLTDGGFAQPAHQRQVVHANLTSFKQGGQDTDTARISHQSEHVSQTLHVGRWRQRTPEDIDPVRIVGRAMPGHSVRGEGSSTSMCVHTNILAAHQTLRFEDPVHGAGSACRTCAGQVAGAGTAA